MMTYQKSDAQMTRGLAILCMVILHLFCRTGSDVLGTPLLWIDQSTPAVYWLGFFAEICVPLYSICTGYAQELLREAGKSSFRARCARILKLMVHYWIVLVLFSVLGLVFDSDRTMPGSIRQFLKSVVLLHSYNGAWWYLNTYVLLLLLPPSVILLPVKKLKLLPGLVGCGAFHVLWYLLDRLGVVGMVSFSSPVLQFLQKEAVNLIGILAYVWAGGLLCKYRAVDSLRVWYERKVPERKQKPVLLLLAVLLFIGANVIHKGVIMGIVALAVFLLFNIWQKGQHTRKVMLFLGKHSTNIWLVHMFFYAYFLGDFVLWTRYPLLMLASLLALSIAASCVVLYIHRKITDVLRTCKRT